MQWDEGVAAPNGEEFTVVGRPREIPILGRAVGTALLCRDQYEVRVDCWPRRLRKAVWRTIVTGEEAERLVGEVAEAITSGTWTPGSGDPPSVSSAR